MENLRLGVSAVRHDMKREETVEEVEKNTKWQRRTPKRKAVGSNPARDATAEQGKALLRYFCAKNAYEEGVCLRPERPLTQIQSGTPQKVCCAFTLRSFLFPDLHFPARIWFMTPYVTSQITFKTISNLQPLRLGPI